MKSSPCTTVCFHSRAPFWRVNPNWSGFWSHSLRCCLLVFDFADFMVFFPKSWGFCEWFLFQTAEKNHICVTETKYLWNFSTSAWSTWPMTGCKARNLFCQLSRDGNSHILGMSFMSQFSSDIYLSVSLSDVLCVCVFNVLSSCTYFIKFNCYWMFRERWWIFLCSMIRIMEMNFTTLVVVVVIFRGTSAQLSSRVTRNWQEWIGE